MNQEDSNTKFEIDPAETFDEQTVDTNTEHERRRREWLRQLDLFKKETLDNTASKSTEKIQEVQAQKRNETKSLKNSNGATEKCICDQCQKKHQSKPSGISYEYAFEYKTIQV